HADLLEADDGRAGGARGDQRVAAQAQRRVDDFVAGAEAGVDDERIDLAPAGAEHTQECHADAGAKDAAALVQIGAAEREHQDRSAVGAGEDFGERPPRPRLDPEPESRRELLRLGGIAAGRGGHDSLHGDQCSAHALQFRWQSVRLEAIIRLVSATACFSALALSMLWRNRWALPLT